MDFDLNSDQNMIRKSVAEFLKKECPYETVKILKTAKVVMIKKSGEIYSFWEN